MAIESDAGDDLPTGKKGFRLSREITQWKREVSRRMEMGSIQKHHAGDSICIFISGFQVCLPTACLVQFDLRWVFLCLAALFLPGAQSI